MAETLISPGVLTRENDQSQISQNPIALGAAIIGPTAKGPVENPQIVIWELTLSNPFGNSQINVPVWFEEGFK